MRCVQCGRDSDIVSLEEGELCINCAIDLIIVTLKLIDARIQMILEILKEGMR